MLRMSKEQYEEHQARVKGATPARIRDELEKAVRWTDHPNAMVREGGKMFLGEVSKLLSMESMNRHQAVLGPGGERYDSKIEARRHQVLKMRQAAGLIDSLKHHPDPIELLVSGVKVGTWQPDFEYVETELSRGDRGRLKVWEDVKGFTRHKGRSGKVSINPAWRAFKFKAKIIRALYPDVEVRVITRDQVLL